MKPAKQTKDFTVCLHGYVLPTGVVYGNVSGITYYYNHEDMTLTVYDEKRNAWFYKKPEKFPEIMRYVRRYIVNSGEFDATIRVRHCQFKQERRDEIFHAVKKTENVHKRAVSKDWQGVGPQEKRPQGATGDYLRYPHMTDQRSVDGRNYSWAWAEKAPEDKKFDYVPTKKRVQF